MPSSANTFLNFDLAALKELHKSKDQAPNTLPGALQPLLTIACEELVKAAADAQTTPDWWSKLRALLIKGVNDVKAAKPTTHEAIFLLLNTPSWLSLKGLPENTQLRVFKGLALIGANYFLEAETYREVPSFKRGQLKKFNDCVTVAETIEDIQAAFPDIISNQTPFYITSELRILAGMMNEMTKRSGLTTKITIGIQRTLVDLHPSPYSYGSAATILPKPELASEAHLGLVPSDGALNAAGWKRNKKIMATDTEMAEIKPKPRRATAGVAMPEYPMDADKDENPFARLQALNDNSPPEAATTSSTATIATATAARNTTPIKRPSIVQTERGKSVREPSTTATKLSLNAEKAAAPPCNKQTHTKTTAPMGL